MATALVALGAWALTSGIALAAVEPAGAEAEHDINAAEDEQTTAAMRERFGG